MTPTEQQPSESAPNHYTHQYCDQCDGCGWYEGGKALQTTCEQCNGTGWMPRAIPLPVIKQTKNAVTIDTTKVTIGASESSHSPQLPDDCQDYLRGENEQCAFAPDNCKKCSIHSPTEQPGDKEIIEAITRAQFGTREQSNHIERHMAEYFTRWHTYKYKFTHLEWYHIFLDFYDSLPLLSEVSTLRSKQAELVEENQRLKSQLKDYCNDCQHPTVNERQATELSKLRQENERYKEALQCMMNVEHHGDFMNAFFDLKDQVKAAQQGE